MPLCGWSSELNRLRRLFLTLPWAGALLGPGGVWAAPAQTVWMAVAERGGVQEDTATAVREGLRRQAAASVPAPEVRTGVWWDFTLEPTGPPSVVVTLGAAAYRGVVERAMREPAWATVPLVATLLPRSSFEASQPPPGMKTTAVWLDQPMHRYAELIRTALPQRRRVGVLWGSTSRVWRAALAEALSARGAQLVDEVLPAEAGNAAVFQTMSAVLQASDVFLMLPDAQVINASSLQNMLIAAYRQRIPVVSYSAAHVRAGATLALHTTPEQAAQQTAVLVRRISQRSAWPGPQAAEAFEVVYNEQVARSLGLNLPEPGALEAAIRRKETNQ